MHATRSPKDAEKQQCSVKSTACAMLPLSNSGLSCPVIQMGSTK